MTPEDTLQDGIRQLHKLKDLADMALAQVTGEDLFRTLDEESNGFAVLMKHLGGNSRSRWTKWLLSSTYKVSR